MNGTASSDAFFVGWDVGGWNCDRNRNSRDAVAILDANLALQGTPWRGNLRRPINEAATGREFVAVLFSLCKANAPSHGARITLAIDTPLGFSRKFLELTTSLQPVERLEESSANPYLFRQTERFLFERGLRPLSAVKDMIGSQSTKGMHVLAKFAPVVQRCGVWSDGHNLTAIEAYPTAGRLSPSLAALRQPIAYHAPHPDQEDALTCALIAYLFAASPQSLIGPDDAVPPGEGWIWVPDDIPRKVKS